jgi:XTP/dITP diphosphohydrolase
MSTLHFVLATANADKAREIVEVLSAAGDGIEIEPRDPSLPDVEETGATLEENARIKAQAICDATNRPAIADDTGLEVDALGGAPGVHSARFAGEGATYADNVEELLRRLVGIEGSARTARFATVAIARWPDGREVAAIGTVEGTIASSPRGEGGFGYDSVFVPDECDGRTFAELSAREKHAVSHRGRAFRTLADGLRVVARIPSPSGTSSGES